MNKRIRVNGVLYEAVKSANESYEISKDSDGETVDFDYAEPDFCSAWWERDDDTQNEDGETEYTLVLNYNNDYIFSCRYYFYSVVKGDREMKRILRNLADRVNTNEPRSAEDIKEFADDFGLKED